MNAFINGLMRVLGIRVPSATTDGQQDSADNDSDTGGFDFAEAADDLGDAADADGDGDIDTADVDDFMRAWQLGTLGDPDSADSGREQYDTYSKHTHTFADPVSRWEHTVETRDGELVVTGHMVSVRTCRGEGCSATTRSPVGGDMGERFYRVPLSDVEWQYFGEQGDGETAEEQGEQATADANA